MTHSHTFILVNPALRKYRCTTCQALGYRHPHKRTGIVTYKCQREVDGKHCGRDAVQVNAADKNANRCAVHYVAKEQAA